MNASKIEWTESTWNPIRGCSRVSEGCRFCYAERVAGRFSGVGQAYAGLTTRGESGSARWNNEIMFVDRLIEQPLRWKRPRRIFVNSMSDLFHEKVSLGWIERIFDVMRRAHWHEFQILTKRSERLASLGGDLDWPPNVWMGVSIEDGSVLGRLDHLRGVGAGIRFVSIEPLIGRLPVLDVAGIDWVIVGGESGPYARPMDDRWAVFIREVCLQSGVAFFMKQMGSDWARRTQSRDRKGGDINEFPEVLRVREYPSMRMR